MGAYPNRYSAEEYLDKSKFFKVEKYITISNSNTLQISIDCLNICDISKSDIKVWVEIDGNRILFKAEDIFKTHKTDEDVIYLDKCDISENIDPKSYISVIFDRITTIIETQKVIEAKRNEKIQRIESYVNIEFPTNNYINTIEKFIYNVYVPHSHIIHLYDFMGYVLSDCCFIDDYSKLLTCIDDQVADMETYKSIKDEHLNLYVEQSKDVIERFKFDFNPNLSVLKYYKLKYS